MPSLLLPLMLTGRKSQVPACRVPGGHKRRPSLGDPSPPEDLHEFNTCRLAIRLRSLQSLPGLSFLLPGPVCLSY